MNKCIYKFFSINEVFNTFLISSEILNTCKNSSKSSGYIVIVCKYPTGADFKLVISTPNNEPLSTYQNGYLQLKI